MNDLTQLALDYLHQGMDWMTVAYFAAFLLLLFYELEKREVNR